VVCNAIEGRWVEFGEGGVRVLAVKAFLESIDPRDFSGNRRRDGN
jgi:hypothetical protein